MRMELAVRIGAALLYAVPWFVIAFLGPDLQPSDDSWLVPLWIGGGVLAGLLIDSFAGAAALVLLVALAMLLTGVLHPCHDSPQNPIECEGTGFGDTALFDFFFLAPITFAIVAAGVILRKGLRILGAALLPPQ